LIFYFSINYHSVTSRQPLGYETSWIDHGGCFDLHHLHRSGLNTSEKDFAACCLAKAFPVIVTNIAAHIRACDRFQNRH